MWGRGNDGIRGLLEKIYEMYKAKAQIESFIGFDCINFNRFFGSEDGALRKGEGKEPERKALFASMTLILVDILGMETVRGREKGEIISEKGCICFHCFDFGGFFGVGNGASEERSGNWPEVDLRKGVLRRGGDGILWGFYLGYGVECAEPRIIWSSNSGQGP